MVTLKDIAYFESKVASDQYWDFNSNSARRKQPKVKGKAAKRQHKKLRQLLREAKLKTTA